MKIFSTQKLSYASFITQNSRLIVLCLFLCRRHFLHIEHAISTVSLCVEFVSASKDGEFKSSVRVMSIVLIKSVYAHPCLFASTLYQSLFYMWFVGVVQSVV